MLQVGATGIEIDRKKMNVLFEISASITFIENSHLSAGRLLSKP
jgi:hypothetical protein